ncbi:EamA family transporter [Defluviitalea raffinosedens]|uniref:EamA family transporter n=1 Tax=Defluviitalea raffinosedens TaxID=1450156 RepID=A0A7C8LM75_9FIRM|nr:EamA family transporter [Defluviitalea raffinosedens]KAE9636943.1 EamA family transporter [Defluviitalea raffinosedens]MBM7685306.1 drug/metabolite transporter (DMT)-like permease [Defluviitalea raffinosedens]HHW67255.1 EamA family transporter [Candidatus Epulonipiscium sp.]
MKNIWVALLSVFLGAIGQVILKVGADQLGELPFSFKTLPKDIIHIIKIPQIILGIILFSVSFLLWIKVLTKNELSYSYPLVSLNYIIIMIMSVFLLGEEISLRKILGTVLIVLGVWVVYV